MLRRGCRRNSLRTRRRLKTYTLWNYGRDNREPYRDGNNTKTVLLHSEEGLCSASLRRWGLLKLPFERRQFILRYPRSGLLCFERGVQERTYENSWTQASTGSAIIFCRIFWYKVLCQSRVQSADMLVKNNVNATGNISKILDTSVLIWTFVCPCIANIVLNDAQKDENIFDLFIYS